MTHGFRVIWLKQQCRITVKELSVARAGWLNDFDNDSRFYAGDRYVDSLISLRGVLLEKKPQASPEKSEDQKPEMVYQEHLGYVLSNPEELTDARASQLLDLVAKHYRK